MIGGTTSYLGESKQCWFLIHTHPRQEERTTQNLRAWKIETLAPQIRDWRHNQFTGSRVAMVKPLFARYVFARFDLERLFHKVRYTRGVRELVSFGEGPVQVDPQIIDLVRSRIGKDGFAKLGDDLTPGDMAVIKEGALKDFTGVFAREINDSERVELLLTTVSYQARVYIQRSMLRKAGACDLGG